MFEETLWVDKKYVGFYWADFGGQKTERAARNCCCDGRFQYVDWKCFMRKFYSKIQTVSVRVGSALWF